MPHYVFLFLLVLVFISLSQLATSKRESQVAPGHHHSSQVVNFSTGTSQVNVLQQKNSSSSYSLSHLQPQTSSLASNHDNSPKIFGKQTSQAPTLRSRQTTGKIESGDGGHDRGNFNDNFISTPADFMSLSQRSTRLSQNRKGVEVSVPSLWSILALDATREIAKSQKTRKRRPLSTTKPRNVRILQASNNSNLSFVQDQENLVLKLDRNYTPKDIAEYILSTGDERGIIQVVEDMMQDGQLMASRDDVILFLETVQTELNKLKALNQLHRPSPPA